jgi:hypothetical protein
MSPQRRQHTQNNQNTLPSPYSYRVGTKDRFIPFNMREGRSYRLIHSAITLSNWAKANVHDVDSFLAYESAYCLLADDMDNVLCPHNTIVQIFYNGFRKRELSQFRWLLHGFQFPRKFNHPLACQERHGTAMAIFPDYLHTEAELRRSLIFCGADEISMQIGIDFLEIPARRIAFHDEDDVLEEIPYSPTYVNEEPTQSLCHSPPPATPQLTIHPNLPKVEPSSSGTETNQIPSPIFHILNAIHVQRAINKIGETAKLVYPSQPSTSHATQVQDNHMNDQESDWEYEDVTNNSKHPKTYDW